MVHDAMVPTLRASRLFDRRFTSTGLSTADGGRPGPRGRRLSRPSPAANAEVEAMLGGRASARRPSPVSGGRCERSPTLVHAPTRRGRGRSAAAGRTWPRRRSQRGPIRARPCRALDPPLPGGVRARLGGGLRPVRPAQAHHRPRSPGGHGRHAHHVGGPRRTGAVRRPRGAAPGRGHAGPAPADGHCGTASCWPTPTAAGSSPRSTARLVIRRNGRRAPHPAGRRARRLGVDGPVDGAVEARAFHPAPRRRWDGLAAEARDLLAFLAARGPAPYRGRYGRWWPHPPAGRGARAAGLKARCPHAGERVRDTAGRASP
jgi:hypothetical protein